MSAKFETRTTAKGLMLVGLVERKRFGLPAAVLHHYSFWTNPEAALVAIERLVHEVENYRNAFGLQVDIAQNFKVNVWNGRHFVARLRLKESHDGRHRLVCERFWGGLLEGEVTMDVIDATIAAQPVLYGYRNLATGAFYNERYFTKAEAVGSVPWTRREGHDPIQLVRIAGDSQTVLMGEVECARHRRASMVRHSSHSAPAPAPMKAAIRLIKAGKLDDYPFILTAPSPIAPIADELSITDCLRVRNAPTVLAVQSEKSTLMLRLAVPDLKIMNRQLIDEMIQVHDS